jgi:hypothetical protein
MKWTWDESDYTHVAIASSSKLTALSVYATMTPGIELIVYCGHSHRDDLSLREQRHGKPRPEDGGPRICCVFFGGLGEGTDSRGSLHSWHRMLVSGLAP